jgi:hypothetical protein
MFLIVPLLGGNELLPVSLIKLVYAHVAPANSDQKHPIVYLSLDLSCPKHVSVLLQLLYYDITSFNFLKIKEHLVYYISELLATRLRQLL